MIELNTVVEHLDGRYYDLAKLGVITRDFIVSSPIYSREYTEIDGMDGVIETDVSLRPRTIAVEFYMQAEDHLRDYVRLRDFVYTVFGGKTPFYIRDMREPTKRWLVALDDEFTPEQIRMYGFFSVRLIASTGVAETVNAARRSYTESSFVFRNAGSVPIDMRSQAETEITFRGASENLTITNLTTGDVWKYNGTTTVEDVITLKGVRSLKNGISIFRYTNKKLITMAVGNNNFEVSGANGEFELAISTRFYF